MVWEQTLSGLMIRYLTRGAGNQSSCDDHCNAVQKGENEGAKFKIRFYKCYNFEDGNADDFSRVDFDSKSDTRSITCTGLSILKNSIFYKSSED